MRRRLLLLTSSLLLATAGCASGGAAGRAPVEAARTTVTAPGSGPAGDHTDVRGLFAGPDGTTLVVLAGADAARGDDAAPGAALAVVGADGTTVQATAELAPGSRPDTAFGHGGGAVVAGVVWPGEGPIGYALQAVDPATGAPSAVLPVAVPGEVQLTGSAAAPGPDGVLYVAVSRSSDAPLLLAVDPATGAVRASAELDLTVDGAVPTSAEVEGLAVAPDGSSIAVTASVLGPDPWAPGRSLLATVGPDLAARGAPVDLAPGYVGSSVGDLAVGPDGTAYAVVWGDDAGRRGRHDVVAVAPGANAPAVLTGGAGLVHTPVTELAVDGGVLWLTLQREAATASLVRLDPATGELGTPVELCDGLAGRLLVDADGTRTVGATCDGEAVLWRLDGH